MEPAVRIVTSPGTPTAVVPATTSWAEYPELWRELLGEVWSVVRGTESAPGRNVMLYKDDRPSVEVGVEVNGPFSGAGRVVASSLPGGRAAFSVARGQPSPELLGTAHHAVTEWCASEGHELTGVRWEIYGHWLDGQDPSRFETEVYWEIAEQR